ncbi:MAG: cytochrome c family protein [Deltaproteobacteria bacterium]|nr:cytochrome c family protein [Deltaproteobacteria bacterium]
MTSKQELRLAYALAVILFVVGVLSYAMTAFSAKTPDIPMRLMFKGVAGKVLFDHKTHTEDAGYGIACVECHHHPEEGEEDYRACVDCHSLAEKEDALPEACGDCHEADEIEDSEITKRVDAFHMQCINCHKENEAGPEKCASCHVI